MEKLWSLALEYRFLSKKSYYRNMENFIKKSNEI